MAKEKLKIVIAPDKFKGSLTGLEFCDAVQTGINHILPEAEIIKLPLADGGDGTMEVIDFYLKGRIVKVTVNNPLFRPITASYLYAASTKTAFIEMAEASGLKLLKVDEFDCKNTSTLGTGELILDAINKGANKIILGIGGSATNDCGVGMAVALGYRFLDKKNEEVKPTGANLSKIASIDDANVHPKLKLVDFQVACDVTNPLYGKDGAAYIYAAQKGASINDIKKLDKGLRDFSKLLNSYYKIKVENIIGAGAAGGMGIGSMLFLNARLKSGIELVKELAQFDAKISQADWIITGEGKLDLQTFSGKTLSGIVNSAKIHDVKIAAFCGSIELNNHELTSLRISYVDSIIEKAKNLQDAIQNSYEYLLIMAKTFAKNIM